MTIGVRVENRNIQRNIEGVEKRRRGGEIHIIADITTKHILHTHSYILSNTSQRSICPLP